jgi:large subunit ribosomal protein L21
MYAVIKTGGKQYRVAANEVVTIEKVAGDAGATVEFTEVLMVAGSGEAKVGKPLISGAKVVAEVVEQGRAPKVIAFKKRRRKNSRRKRGHRQEFTLIRITEILTEGKKPSKTAAPRPRKPKAEPKAEAEAKAEAETKAAAPKAKAKAKTKPKAAAKPKAGKTKKGK